MKSFSQLITARRSMRKFTDEQLTPEQVRLLLRAALIAPTSKRTNSWEFIVVDDKELLKSLSVCKPVAAQFIAEAALAVVVCADPLKSDVWIEDASIASIYMQLQAEDLGLGSCWVQVRERMSAGESQTSGEYISQLLDIPQPLQVLSVIAFGHKGMERKPFNEDNLQWEKVHMQKF
ncbi:MAG: nitroreductase family protein [Bacteroidales bacterium]|nr:nitroreductase family protein [Bacteroidales bacterium]